MHPMGGPVPQQGSRKASPWVLWAPVAVTVVLALFTVVEVFRSGSVESTNSEVPALATVAFVVLGVCFAAPLLLQRLDLRLSAVVPWLVGAASLILSVILGMLWTPVVAASSWADVVSRGLHVPRGLAQFWDLSLVLKSVDCASHGFDVYAANNGCLPQPSIYGPGTLWLQYVPFDLFSARNATTLGFISLLISSVALAWIARQASPRGQVVLLVAAVGGPWLLLLERANFDAYVIWAAVLLVFLVRRWNSMWAWTVGAAIIWLVGTWKYYPFALGLMLIPVVRLRRGWIVLAGFVAASGAFVVLTWDNLIFSLHANEAMAISPDLVILGRFPVVARMIGADADPTTRDFGDLVFLLLAGAAFLWGIAFARCLRGARRTESMLAIGGSTLFLASVLVAGFGYAYKAAFLLLIVPLVALPRQARDRFLLYSSVVVLVLITVASVVTWNTVLATLAGVVAASFGLGASSALLVRFVRGDSEPSRQRSEPTAGR